MGVSLPPVIPECFYQESESHIIPFYKKIIDVLTYLDSCLRRNDKPMGVSLPPVIPECFHQESESYVIPFNKNLLMSLHI